MMSKKYFVITVLAGLLLGILAVGSAVGSTLLDEAEKLSWDKQNIGALKALFPNATSVETFLKEAKPFLAVAEARVGEYEIADLNNNGDLELLATIDVSGRKIYSAVYVVHKFNNILKISELNASGDSIGNLKSCIVDLNGDGVKEFLLPRLLDYTKIGMATPRPIINDVYEWDGSEFRQANVSFKNYYRSLLPGLKAEHEAIVHSKKLDVPSQKALLEEKNKREIEEINKILND
jgi:hypothetical protein